MKSRLQNIPKNTIRYFLNPVKRNCHHLLLAREKFKILNTVKIFCETNGEMSTEENSGGKRE